MFAEEKCILLNNTCVYIIFQNHLDNLTLVTTM